jgi:hypothetical protein
VLPTEVWLVVGCHRSGTSLFSSILRELGGKLPSDLLRPSLSNIRGFNESWHWVRINDLILKRMGLTWDSIVPTSKCIESQSFIDSQKKYVTKAFLEGFPQNDRFESPLVIKDPRICRTFPVWERALVEMGSNIKIFLPVRHPFEVIQSLVLRDGFTPQKACYIWMWNLIEALIFTVKHNPTVIIYDKLILDPANYLTDIFGYNVPENTIQKIDSKLNHNKLAKNLFPLEEEPFRTAMDLFDQIYNLKTPSRNLVVFCEKIRYHSQFVVNFEKRIFNRKIKGLINNRLRVKKDEIGLEFSHTNRSWYKCYFALKSKIITFLNMHEKSQ